MKINTHTRVWKKYILKSVKKLNTRFIYRQQRLNVAYSTATVAFKYTRLWSWHKRVFGCSDRETSYGVQNFFLFPLTYSLLKNIPVSWKTH